MGCDPSANEDVLKVKVTVPEFVVPAGIDALLPMVAPASIKVTAPVSGPFPLFVTVAVKVTGALRAEGVPFEMTEVVVGFTVRTSPLRLIVPDEFAASEGIVSVPRVFAPPAGRFWTWGAKSTSRVQDWPNSSVGIDVHVLVVVESRAALTYANGWKVRVALPSFSKDSGWGGEI